MEELQTESHSQAIPPSRKTFSDRDLWIAIRAALLAIVSAIEKRWNIGSHKAN